MVISFLPSGPFEANVFRIAVWNLSSDRLKGTHIIWGYEWMCSNYEMGLLAAFRNPIFLIELGPYFGLNKSGHLPPKSIEIC